MSNKTNKKQIFKNQVMAGYVEPNKCSKCDKLVLTGKGEHRLDLFEEAEHDMCPDSSVNLHEEFCSCEEEPEEDSNQTGVRVQAIGLDGNVFAVMGRCSQALRRAGFAEEAEQMVKEVRKTHSYDDALMKIGEYVELF